MGCRVSSEFKFVPDEADERKLQELAAKAPGVALRALNNTGFIVRPQMKEYVKRTFDNPTPAFYNSILFMKATPDKPGEAYLYVGNRSDAAANKRLSMIAVREDRGTTAVPSDYDRKMWSIPTKDLVGYRNKYGGLRGGTVKKLKGQKSVFIGTVNGTLAVWRRVRTKGKKQKGSKRNGPRVNDKIVSLIVFRPKADYKPIYSFDKEAERLVKAAFPGELRKEMNNIISGSRMAGK